MNFDEAIRSLFVLETGNRPILNFSFSENQTEISLATNNGNSEKIIRAIPKEAILDYFSSRNINLVDDDLFTAFEKKEFLLSLSQLHIMMAPPCIKSGIGDFYEGEADEVVEGKYKEGIVKIMEKLSKGDE